MAVDYYVKDHSRRFRLDEGRRAPQDIAAFVAAHKSSFEREA